MGKTTRAVRCLETGIIYPTVRDAAFQNRLDEKDINLCLSGNIASAGQLHWEIVEDYKPPKQKKKKRTMPSIAKMESEARKREEKNGGKPVSYGDLQKEWILKKAGML